MTRRFLGSLAALMLSVGLAQAQPYGPPPGPPGPPPFGPVPPPPPWAMPYPPPYPPRYYYPPPYPPPPYPPYQYPARPYATPQTAGPERAGEPPLAAAPKETPPVHEAPPGPALVNVVDQDRGPCLRFWLTPEYLYWFASPGHSPPLVTTGLTTDGVPGALGQPHTQTLFGGNLNYPGMSGIRLSLGGWIDPDNKFALEAQGFILEQGVINYGTGSNASGTPLLAVPVFNATTQAEGGRYVAYPGALSGTVNSTATSRLYGAEFNGYYNMFRYCGLAMDAFVGFRYLGLQESLSLNTNVTSLTTGDMLATNDNFSTNNQFFGGQIGLRGTYQWRCLFVQGVLKSAFGVNNQTVDVNGSSTTSTGFPPAAAGTYPGGILAQPSNIGHHSEMGFSAVPQLQLKVGVEITPYMRVFAGYDFMYWTGVVRPGDQIDHTVNMTQSLGGTLVGPANPAPLFNRSNYYVQGVSAGIEFRY